MLRKASDLMPGFFRVIAILDLGLVVVSYASSNECKPFFKHDIKDFLWKLKK